MANLYIGRAVEPEAMEVPGADVLLDTRDLTRHAVCVGMTGSGKTGLCVALLEELAVAGVPVVVIDPKGDMGNLALALGGQPAEAFLPWTDPGEAERHGLSPQDYAARTAERWRAGLAEWGVDEERVRAYSERAQVRVYTPGSTAGLAVDMLGCLDAPSAELLADAEGIADHAAGVVAALLGLVGEQADPIGDPATVTLAQLLLQRWSTGQPADLLALLPLVVDPPFARVGVFPLDTFWPRKARLALAMKLNGLVASPAFATWSEGVRLDAEQLLRTDGPAQVSVFSLAHLDEGQRMFFASTLLSELVSWSRRQPGTSSLRGLVYFDEVFGYLPPHPKDPPTKRPILTLMKQARAVGLGTMLVTQNPVDVDYKALSNAGTWLIGRLQTRQDRERVLDGLGDADARIGDWLEALPGRTFLLRRTSKPPMLLRSRQVICYLRGPLTLREVERLGQTASSASAPPEPSSPAAQPPQPGSVPPPPPPQRGAAPPPPPPQRGAAPPPPPPQRGAAPPPPPRGAAPPPPPVTRASVPPPPPWSAAPSAPPAWGATSQLLSGPPPAPGGMGFRYLSPEVVFSSRFASIFEAHARPPRQDGAIEWAPAVLASLRLRFDEGRDWSVDRDEHRLVFPLAASGAASSHDIELEASDFLSAPPRGLFEPLPTDLDEAKELDALQRAILDAVFDGETEHLYRCRALKLQSRAGEDEASFRQRCVEQAEAEAAAEGEKLAAKVRTQIDRLQDRVRAKERALDAAQVDAKSRQATELLGAAETVFSWFSGRRRSVSSVMSRRGTTARAGQRVERIGDELDDLRQDLLDLDERTGEQLADLREAKLALAEDIEVVDVRLERTDMRVDGFGVVWIPLTRAY